MGKISGYVNRSGSGFDEVRRYAQRGMDIPIAKMDENNHAIVGHGDEIDGLALFCDLYDGEWIESKGLIPITLNIPCPRCAQPIAIRGDAKTIRVDYLDKGQRRVYQSNCGPLRLYRLVTVEEDCMCPYEGSAKMLCGMRFRIRESRISKVRK